MPLNAHPVITIIITLLGGVIACGAVIYKQSRND